MKSIVMSSHTWHAMGNDCNNPAGESVSDLARWYTSQEETYSSTIRAIDGQ